MYEAPHKLVQTLNELETMLGDRTIVLARELTKIHEEYLTGTVRGNKTKNTNPKR